jgi:hypothetical protein
MLASGVRSRGFQRQPGDGELGLIRPTVDGHERLVSGIHEGRDMAGRSNELAGGARVWLQDALHASMGGW